MKARQTIERAIERAENGASMANYQAIFDGFIARGIPADEIKPRENVFTFQVWKAKGRQVRKRPDDIPSGQYGVRLISWIDSIDKKTGKPKLFPVSSTVFHISQTDPIE